MNCQICGGRMGTLFSIPKMPLCEGNHGGYVDQSFTYCEGCSHGKLGTIVSPAQLYADGYAPSAKSVGSSSAIVNFAAFIMKWSYDANFDCVVDIGGNDGSLLSYFLDKRCISIDQNASNSYGNAELIKQFIEDADIGFLKGVPKLICCSHTLEHIENPDKLFAKLKEVVSASDTCAFQFPSLEYLVHDCRIDQIYHQHIHYYSLRSISLMLAKHGFQIVSHQFDPTHYGALMVLFKKGLQEAHSQTLTASAICRANDLFIAQASALNDRLAKMRGLIGYGASFMLPLLAYYLPAVAGLDYIVDEDESKHGMRYANLDIEVMPVHEMAGRDVMVTAFNTKMAVRAIVQKLFAAKAREVIVPFNFL